MNRELPRRQSHQDFLSLLQQNFQDSVTSGSSRAQNNPQLTDVFEPFHLEKDDEPDVFSLIGIVANPNGIRSRQLQAEVGAQESKVIAWDKQVKVEMERLKPFFQTHLIQQLWGPDAAPQEDYSPRDYIATRPQVVEIIQPEAMVVAPVEPRTSRLTNVKNFLSQVKKVRQDVGGAAARYISESLTDPFKGYLTLITDLKPGGKVARWAEERINGLKTVDEIAELAGRSGLPETFGALGGAFVACTPRDAAKAFATPPPAMVENQQAATAQPTGVPTRVAETAVATATLAPRVEASPTPTDIGGEFTQDQMVLIVDPNRRNLENAGITWGEGSYRNEQISTDGTNRVLTTIAEGTLAYGEQTYEKGTMFFNSKVKPGEYTFITPSGLSEAAARYGYAIDPAQVAHGAWNPDGGIAIFDANGALLTTVSGYNEEYIPAPMLDQFPGTAYIVGETQAFDAAGNLLYERGADGQFEMVPNAVQIESLNPYNWCADFDTKAVDSYVGYLTILRMIVEGSPNYWRDLGINPDVDSALQYLRTVNYEVPAVSPSGYGWRGLYEDEYGRGYTREYKPVGGTTINLSDVKFMLIPSAAGRVNSCNFEQVLNQPDVGKRITKVTDKIQYGLGLYTDPAGKLRPVWLTMNRATEEHFETYKLLSEFVLNPDSMNDATPQKAMGYDNYNERHVTAQILGTIKFLTEDHEEAYVAKETSGLGTANHVDMTARSVEPGSVLFEKN